MMTCVTAFNSVLHRLLYFVLTHVSSLITKYNAVYRPLLVNDQRIYYLALKKTLVDASSEFN